MRNADLRHLTAQEVLQCADLRTFYRYFPSWVSGVDKQLRPIAWRKLGRLEVTITRVYCMYCTVSYFSLHFTSSNN